MNANTTLVDALILSMKNVVKQKCLDLLEIYPNDLLVHDRNFFLNYAKPGAKFAWCVGHMHSHLVVLGLHRQDNELVHCFTNLASDDKFYLITISSYDSFNLKELDKKAFEALSSEPIPYQMVGDKSAFWLMRNGHKLGYITTEHIGHPLEHAYSVKVTPVSGISELDANAVAYYANKAAIFVSGTLFTRWEVIENPATVINLAA